MSRDGIGNRGAVSRHSFPRHAAVEAGYLRAVAFRSYGLSSASGNAFAARTAFSE
jgi:hypothetical protein